MCNCPDSSEQNQNKINSPKKIKNKLSDHAHMENIEYF